MRPVSEKFHCPMRFARILFFSVCVVAVLVETHARADEGALKLGDSVNRIEQHIGSCVDVGDGWKACEARLPAKLVMGGEDVDYVGVFIRSGRIEVLETRFRQAELNCRVLGRMITDGGGRQRTDQDGTTWSVERGGEVALALHNRILNTCVLKQMSRAGVEKVAALKSAKKL